MVHLKAVFLVPLHVFRHGCFEVDRVPAMGHHLPKQLTANALTLCSGHDTDKPEIVHLPHRIFCLDKRLPAAYLTDIAWPDRGHHQSQVLQNCLERGPFSFRLQG